MRTRFAAIVAATGALVLGAAPVATAAPGASGLSIAKRIPGPDGGWDYVSFDAARRRVLIAHGTQVMTIDADSGKVNPAFAPGDHLHSVLAVPGTHLLVTTNSGDSSARILDAADGHLLASIPTAKDTDGAVYDPSTKLVLVIDGDSGEVTLVDPRTKTSPGSIAIGDPLEFGVVDGRGRFFVDLVSKNAVAVVDIAARKVVATWPLTDCRRPTGIAFVSHARLVVACASGAANILDARGGRVIAAFKIGGFTDSVLYDEARSMAYIPSALSGDMAVIALAGPADNTIIDTVPTQLGARTGAVDPRTGAIYLPTAQYILPAPAGKRPQPKPGTFEVLVLGRR